MGIPEVRSVLTSGAAELRSHASTAHLHFVDDKRRLACVFSSPLVSVHFRAVIAAVPCHSAGQWSVVSTDASHQHGRSPEVDTRLPPLPNCQCQCQHHSPIPSTTRPASLRETAHASIIVASWTKDRAEEAPSHAHHSSSLPGVRAKSDRNFTEGTTILMDSDNSIVRSKAGEASVAKSVRHTPFPASL
jgi:hypothetical protein